MVLDSVPATSSKLAYGHALDQLFTFSAGRPLSRALLQRWRASMDGALNVTAHVSENNIGRRSNIDRRTTRHPGYALSLSRRWLVEKGFGWLKQRSRPDRCAR